MARRWSRVVKKLIALAAIAWVCCAAALFVLQDSLLYHPGAAVDRSPADVGLQHAELEIATEDGETLRAWWVEVGDSRGTLVFFHGNAGTRAHRLSSIRRFVDLGLDVLIVDYRGYGGSSGQPDEAGLVADARATWAAATARGARPDSTVIFGRSLGGAVAAALAAERPAAGLILESTFTSLPELARELYPLFAVGPLVRSEFPTRANVERFAGPVLVLHSPDDALIPFIHGQRLHAAASARGPATFFELRGDHNDAPATTGPAYVEALDGFLGQVLGSR